MRLRQRGARQRTPRHFSAGPAFNLPSLNYSAVALLAGLHGRCGYFPATLRLRPVEGSIPVEYDVAEVIDLQAVRGEAGQRRG